MFKLSDLCQHRYHTLENSSSWVMSQNSLIEWDCKMLKSAILREKIDKSTWFLARWYRFKKHEGWFVNFYFGVVEYLN